MATKPRPHPTPEQALPGDVPRGPEDDPRSSLPPQASYRRELTVTRWIVIAVVVIAAAIAIWGLTGFAGV